MEIDRTAKTREPQRPGMATPMPHWMRRKIPVVTARDALVPGENSRGISSQMADQARSTSTR